VPGQPCQGLFTLAASLIHVGRSRFAHPEATDLPPLQCERWVTLHVSTVQICPAQIAGSSIYGGSLDSCTINVEYTTSTVQQSLSILSLNWNELNLDLEPNSISSDPFQVCMCEDEIPNCNTSELVRQVYPGELLHFPVVATGQRDGIVPAVIKASFSNKFKHGNTSLAQFQNIQEVKEKCTQLYYQVHSSATNHNETLVLYADGPCSVDGRLLNIPLIIVS